VGRYLAALGASHGIVTTGETWVFLRTRLKPGAKKRYFVEPLLRVTLREPAQRRLLIAALGRCARGTLSSFLATLDALRDFRATGINRAVDPVPRAQWPSAIRRAMPRDRQRAMKAGDFRVLRLACHSLHTLHDCLLHPYKTAPTTVVL
jgi:hypothetical protein